LINWNEKELVRWIGTDERPLKRGSRELYSLAFRHYTKFTRKSAKQLIDEAEWEFTNASQRERGVVKNRLLNFREWLIGNGIKPNSANTYVQAIRSFYTNNNFKIQFQRREIPRVFPETQRKMLMVEDVKKYLDSATNQRDKSIIICIYQSGMDLDTLLNLKYVDLQRARDFNGRKMLNVIRRKVGGRYRTFLGKDAVTFLENYLVGQKLKLNTPLFRGYGGKPLKKCTVHAMFRKLAIKSGVLTREELEHYPINQAGAHSLRASFSKIGTAVGINKNVIDYFMGHMTPYSGAYTDLPDIDLYNIYRKLEPHLSVSQAIVSAMDKLREQGRLWGIDLDKAIERRAREMAESGMGSGGGFMPDVESDDFAREVLKKEIQRLLGSPPRGATQQKVVDESDLEEYLANGWRYVNSLNNGSGKYVISKN